MWFFIWMAGLLASGPASAQVPPSSPGDLLVTEFMAEPDQRADYVGEWFEVYNATQETLNLDGLRVLTDGAKETGFTIEGGIHLQAHRFLVLGVSGDMVENGNVPVEYVYSFDIFKLDSLNADYIQLVYNGVVIDEVVWFSMDWPVERQHSCQANLNAFDQEWSNDLPQNWCMANAFIKGSPSLYGTPGSANQWCSGSNIDQDGDGFTAEAGDCNDLDETVSPAVIDGVDVPYGIPADDADCDGIRDDGITDDDEDGYSEVQGDCDDAEPLVNPGFQEGTLVAEADGLDNDCNCYVDDMDYDGDGFSYYPEATFALTPGCLDPAPADRPPTILPDCDNHLGEIYPGATETPYDAVDQDCDGLDLCDIDGDGYEADPAIYCPGGGCCEGGNDCDDGSDAVHPGAPESKVKDGIDNDCNGITDDYYRDDDDDGVTTMDGDCDDTRADIFPGAAELCSDLTDNDCNGLINDGCTSDQWFASIRGGGCGALPMGLGAGLGATLASLLLAFRLRRPEAPRC